MTLTGIRHLLQKKKAGREEGNRQKGQRGSIRMTVTKIEPVTKSKYKISGPDSSPLYYTKANCPAII